LAYAADVEGVVARQVDWPPASGRGMSSSDREGFVKVANAFAEALESAFPVEEAQLDRASR